MFASLFLGLLTLLFAGAAENCVSRMARCDGASAIVPGLSAALFGILMLVAALAATDLLIPVIEAVTR